MKSPIAMAALTAALAALAAQPAAAQPAATQPPKHSNSKAPWDVTADHMETHNAECVAIFTGSAEALQDTSRLRADKMIVVRYIAESRRLAIRTSRFASVLMQIKRECDAAGLEPA